MPLCGWYLRFPGVSACYLQLYCPHVLYAYFVPPLKNLQDHFLSPNRSLWTLGLNSPHCGLSRYYPRPSSDSPENLRITRTSTGSAHKP